MKSILAFLIVILALDFFGQNINVPDYYDRDEKLNGEISGIVRDLGLDKDFDVGEDGIEQISLAVIDLSAGGPRFGGYNVENLIYPASVYKMYVAAAVLGQISEGKYSLETLHVVKEHNAVDKSREIEWDPRPLLAGGDTVTIGYLLDLMITRSDNSAANCLIDVATRPEINRMIKMYGWEGSEVTRKFLKRKLEDPGYAEVPSTMTCGLHAADFLYKIYQSELINEWVSRQMMTLLGRQLDKSKLAKGLPGSAMYYHKTGWFSYWTHDVGIVADGKAKYVIACFLPIEEEKALPIMRELSRRIYDLLKKGVN
ncbi:MAG: serine hydrolase [Ignavibacteriaceae bacterium]